MSSKAQVVSATSSGQSTTTKRREVEAGIGVQKVNDWLAETIRAAGEFGSMGIHVPAATVTETYSSSSNPRTLTTDMLELPKESTSAGSAYFGEGVTPQIESVINVG